MCIATEFLGPVNQGDVMCIIATEFLGPVNSDNAEPHVKKKKH